MKYSGIGGQAVIEGIMMKNKDRYAVAVRKPDGEIALEEQSYTSMSEKFPLFRLPFIRGVFAFVDSMVLGMKSLNFSAGFFEDDEETKPSPFLEKLDKAFGGRLESLIMGAATLFSLAAALAVFILLPLYLGSLLRRVVDSHYLVAVLEGVIRIVIFILYLLLISRLKDIKRTFMYHGAEHKCINCIENGLELTVDNVMASSKEHKRCGTSFLLLVMMISILFFMVLRVDGILPKFALRILLLPVIAGVSYEFLSLAGRSNSPIVHLLSRPGMMMQALTTKESSRDMVEVAIAAVEKVFDWRTYRKENFGP